MKKYLLLILPVFLLVFWILPQPVQAQEAPGCNNNVCKLGRNPDCTKGEKCFARCFSPNGGTAGDGEACWGAEWYSEEGSTCACAGSGDDNFATTCLGLRSWAEIDDGLRRAGYGGPFDHSPGELAAFDRGACGPYTVAGKVVDGSDKTLAGITVNVNDDKGNTKTATTDTNGQFSLANFIKNQGAYSVRIPKQTKVAEPTSQVKITTVGWTLQYGGPNAGKDMDVNTASSYEFQKAGNNDCAGAAGAGGASGRCSFKIVGSDPKGSLDGGTCEALTGWTCDPDNFNTDLRVDFYADGPAGTGTPLTSTQANAVREAAVGAQCGGNANHGFSYAIPQNALRDGQPHKIYAYGINTGAGTHTLLPGSSRSVTCTTSPVGSFDTASCTSFTGWARDADSASTGLQIDFWLEKNTGNNADLTANQYLGFVIANQSRADLPFADKNHSFSFDPKTIIPSDKWPLFFAGKARDISAFAINVDSSGVRQDRLAAGGSLLHTQLLSNKTVTCQADKPPYRIEFRVSENPNFASAQWEVYQGAVMTRNFTFQDKTPGMKTVFVEFKDSLGKTEKDSAQIELVAPPSPSPVPSPSVIPSPPAVPSPSPTPSAPPVVTTHFRIAETPADLSGAEWQSYTSQPVKIDNFEFKDKTSGPKFIWAEFKDSKGKIERRSQAIRLLGDDPVITSCSLGFEDNNTTLRIKGKNFGSAQGTVKSGSSTLQIKGSWKDDSVEASLPDAKAGQIIPVSLTSTDSQSVDGSCGSISALALGAKVFCKQPSSHQTDDVALTLAGAFEGGTKVKQQVSIDKDGVIKGLTAKLEEGKSYILSLKAPRGIRKTSKVFTAGNGVTNVPNFILWVGDIFPIDGGDGVINTLDKQELNRQWSSIADAKGRTGDFNQDGRVNSLDWACMSFSMVDAQGRSDDKEPEPGVQSSPASSPSPEGQTCGGKRGIKCADGYKCQLESNDPDAMGSCVPPPNPSSSVTATPASKSKVAATSCSGETVEGGDATFRSSYTDQDGNLVKIYDIKSGGKAKVTAQTTPPGAYINWKIAPYSQYLPDGGGTLTSDPNNPAVVTYTAPNNPTSEAQGAYVRGDYSDNPWKACPPVDFAVKPVNPSPSATPESEQPG